MKPVKKPSAAKPSAAIMAAVAAAGVVLAFVTIVLCAERDVPATDGYGGEGASVEAAPEVAAASLFEDDSLERDASISEAGVSLPSVCAEEGVLESTAKSGLGVRATWEVDVGLVEAAEGIVESYRDAGGFTLAYDGYLDLMGRVWGCVALSGDGWVEVAIVDERGSDGDAAEEDDGLRSCSVTVVRFGES